MICETNLIRDECQFDADEDLWLPVRHEAVTVIE